MFNFLVFFCESETTNATLLLFQTEAKYRLRLFVIAAAVRHDSRPRQQPAPVCGAQEEGEFSYQHDHYFLHH